VTLYKACTCLVLLLSTLLVPIGSYAASLNTGSWEIIANGFQAQLNIDSIDGQGNLVGSYFDGTRRDQIAGFWDEGSRKITFVRTLGSPQVIQVFTGYLLNPGATTCQQGDIRRMLTGSFEAFSSTGGSARRSVFGWTARFCVVG
jgi:hypothetical protein